MKKITLTLIVFFLAALSTLTAQAQVQANIYASELKASAVAENGDVTFTFTLNADAESIVINVYDGNTLLTSFTENTGPYAKGVKTFTRRLPATTAVGDYTWTVTATGASQSPSSVTKVSSNDVQMRFYGTRGVAVDNTFDSPYFGRVYVAETSGGTTSVSGARTVTKGIYVLDAALTDITNQGNTSYAGGETWGGYSSTGPTHSPYRLAVAPSGDLYIADFSTAHGGVWKMNSADPSANFTGVFNAGVVSGVHGRITDCYVLGSGDATQLYTFDVDYTDAVATNTGNLLRYDIGNLTSKWTASPSAIVYNDANTGYTKAAGTPVNNLEQNFTGNSIAPDGNGGWWISQYRSTDSEEIPSLIHVNTSSVVDFNSGTTNLIVNSYQGGMTVSPDGTLLAIATGTGSSPNGGKISIYTIDYTNGVSLTPLTTLVNGASNVNQDIAFDRANNLYLVSYQTENLSVWALPKADNTFTTPAPSSQPVAVAQTIVVQSEKTFTVTVPNGTEHVYIAGTFTNKEWDLTNPLELTKSGTNTFTGTFPCNATGVEYKYYCEKGADYVEGVDGGTGNPAEARAASRSLATETETTDDVPFWYQVNKITYKAAFADGVVSPPELFIRIASTDYPMTRAADGTFTYVLGGSAGDKYRTNTEYKYRTSNGGTGENWETTQAGNRWSVAPGMNDTITGFTNPTTFTAGTYYVPNDPQNGSRWFASLTDAFSAINGWGISGNITLLINGDINQTENVGLINPTDYTITIRPDADADRTVTFSDPVDTDPSGAICIGIKGIGANKTWNNIVISKNIIIDGYAEGSFTRRLAIKTAAAQNYWNGPIAIINGSSNIQIKNCIIEHASGHNTSRTYAIWIRAHESYAPKKFPSDILIENNQIISNAFAANTGIGITKSGSTIEESNYASGVVIKDNIFNVRSIGIMLAYLNGINITGNEFHVVTTNSGYLINAIYGNMGITGNVNIHKNKFIEFKTTNTSTGAFGVRGIVASGGGTWYIDNNYFTGFDKTTNTAGETMLQAIRVGSSCVIRHNTFHLNKVTNVPSGNTYTTPTDAQAVYCAINIAAGTPVIENNLFVSHEDAFPNYFIRGNATANNNVFYLKGNVNAAIATDAVTGMNTTAENAPVFTDAPAGDLSIAGASLTDIDLSVPRLADVTTDITGKTRAELTYAGAREADLPFSVKTAAWTPQIAAPHSWTNAENWTPAFEPGTAIGPRTHVILPGKAASYPVLEGEVFCDTITFKQGAEIGQIQYLKYNRALVELNFNSNAADSETVEKDRYYTITSPLKNTVSGDYAFGGKPFAYAQYAKVAASEGNGDLTAYFGDALPDYDKEIDPLGNTPGFAYYVRGEGSELGQDQGNLTTNGKGVLSLPAFISQTGADVSGTINPHHEFDGDATSTFYYYDQTNSAFPRLDGKTPATVTRGKTDSGIYLGHRFAAEGDDNQIPAAINKSLSAGLNLVGNPFLSHLNFGALYTANSSVIEPYFKIWKGESMYTVQVDAGGYYQSSTNSDADADDLLIAPIQAFFVEAKSSESPLSVKVADVSVVTKAGGAVLRSETDDETLKIVARSAEGASAIVLNRQSGAENTYIPKVFTPFEKIPEIFIAGEKAGEIGNISTSLASVPLGIRALDETEITLTFNGLDNIQDPVRLYDSKTGATHSLTPAENTYSFTNDESNMRNRFFLLFSGTGITESGLQDGGITIVRNRETLRIVSSPLDLIRSVKVFNLHGQPVAVHDGTATASTEITVSRKGVYLIDVTTEKSRRIEKTVIY